MVALSVSDTSELRLANSFVTIPAGRESATVALFAVDDNLLDGTQVVTVTGLASNMQPGSADIAVQDYETFDLRLNSPTVFENNDVATVDDHAC